MPSTTMTSNPISSTTYCPREPQNQWADVDHPLFYYDPEFKDFCFQKLSELENLSQGWDYENAPPLDRQIINSVRKFVEELPEHIAPKPMIVPLSTGNVQLEWQNGPAVLELEFESTEKVHYLKWNPSKSVEEEDIILISQRDKLVDLIRWFMKEMLDAK